MHLTNLPIQTILLQILTSSALARPTIVSRQATCPASNVVNPSICYYGANFPDTSEWIDFTCLFDLYKPAMLSHDSDAEVGYIWDAVTSAAQSSGLDERIIFGIIMQETGLTGDVRERLGDNGLAHGLMQVHGGSDCLGTVEGGCTAAQVATMINDAIHGTSQTQGLLSCFNQEGQSYAKALRCYNSGSVTDPGDLTIGLGTRSYVSDVGNILRGALPSWAATSSNCGF